MNKKIVALLAIVLLTSLIGCSGTSGVDDVPPSSNVESPTPSEPPETPPGAIESTDLNQDPTPSEKPIEPTQEPIESEPPEETIAPTIPEQTDPPTSSGPSSAPTHTHSYTSVETKQATCGTDGTRTFTCSCGDSYNEVIKSTGNHNYSSAVTKEPTCAEEGVKTYTCSTCGNMYNEAIARTNDHSWTIRHIDEVGHYESSGTHRVVFKKCNCGFEMSWDAGDSNASKAWEKHTIECKNGYINWTEEVPNDPQYVVDTPAHDETYCTVCGITQ